MVSPMPRAKKPKKPPENPRLPRSFDRLALAENRSYWNRAVGLSEWTRETVRHAVTAQVCGRFSTAVRLARDLMREPAIFAAALNRGAPHRGLKRTIAEPAGTKLEGTAASVLAEARATFASPTSTCLSSALLGDAFKRVALHATSVEQIRWEQRADGSRMDPFVETWPLEYVEWDEQCRRLMALTTEGRVPIVHGDGRWIVSAPSVEQPWTMGALVALGELWVELRFGRVARSNNADSHGDDKWIGTLPEGVAMEDPQVEEMLEELLKLYESRRAMCIPHGATVKRDEALGQNYNIFVNLLEAGLKDAARVLLGQDGTMTNSGGNYIKSWGLFGVRNDIIESDFATVGGAMSTGLLRPWSLLNFGRWDRLEYGWLIPDADEDARRESIAKRREAFWTDLEKARANGAIVDQPYVDEIALAYGVTPPRLANATPSGADIYAYELEMGVFTINEARERKGAPPRPGGERTVPEDRALQAPPATTPAAARERSDGPTSITAHRQPLRPAGS